MEAAGGLDTELLLLADGEAGEAGAASYMAAPSWGIPSVPLELRAFAAPERDGNFRAVGYETALPTLRSVLLLAVGATDLRLQVRCGHR